jgi:hypothetical protein
MWISVNVLIVERPYSLIYYHGGILFHSQGTIICSCLCTVDRVVTHTHWGWTSGYAYNQATMEEQWGTMTAVRSTNHSEAGCEWRSNYISRRSLSYLLSISSHSYALTHTHTHTCTQCYRVIQVSVVILWMVEMELYQWTYMPAPHCQSQQVLDHTKEDNVSFTSMDNRMNWWVREEKILCCAI